MGRGRKLFNCFCAWGAIMGVLGTQPLQAQVPANPIVMDLRTEPARQTTVQLLTERSVQAKQGAEALANQRGWPIRGALPGGRQFELMEVVNGQPRYYITVNANAAISTAADRIRNTVPYSVNGAGYTVGIWDGGAVRSTHQEFGARVLIKDGATVANHATHVGGTIGAAGVAAAALGMAPSVSIDSYEWTSDTAEMTSRAATGSGQAGKIHVSNHSYGFVTGWQSGTWSGNNGPHFWGVDGEREDRRFGQYSEETVSWDSLHYNAPYYLAFKAAANDRNQSAPAAGTTYYYFSGGWLPKAYAPATDPFADGWDQGGYDTMEEQACAKNIMTVGAVNDAVSGGVRVPANGTMSAFSNWGPTDDGRIKPDIVANGVGLSSSTGASDTSYGGMSGTSMATPNAAGSAILLVEYYGELFPGQAMRSSTLKGLIIHTADDLGTAGPDYAYGWGLMNTEAAADQLKAHAEASSSLYLREGLLTAGNPSESFMFTSDGVSTIRATICWTDPAGTARTGLDDRTAVLVNDLDLRIAGPGGTPVYSPYVLNVNSPTSAATTGDNIVDNVEQIRIAAPGAGTYTLTVSHKGTLSGGQQHYSLILNGQVTFTISGSVTTSGGAGVSGVTINGLPGNPVTDSAGNYSATVPSGWSGTATPAKAGDTPIAKGVTTLDSALIRQHILTPPSSSLTTPYKLLAADVNASEAVTTLDSALVRQIVLSMSTQFPAGLWRFVPSDYIFPNPQSPWTAPSNRLHSVVASDIGGQSFTAIKLGDVNNNWSPPPALSGDPSLDAIAKAAAVPGSEVEFQVGRYTASLGETVNVSVTARGFTRVTSAQFTLAWDPLVLRFTEISAYGLRGMRLGDFATAMATDGWLAFAWDDSQATGVTIANGAAVFTVSFQVIGATGSMSPVILTDAPTVREVGVDFAAVRLISQNGQVLIAGTNSPMVSVAGYQDGVFQLSLPTTAGQRYVLEFADSLPASQWISVSTTIGDGTAQVLSDTSATNRQRYYRVRIE